MNSLLGALLLLAFSMNGLAYASDYPELNVTPRASDRLKIEADREAENRLSFQMPITASALLTLTAGIMQDVDVSSDPDERSPLVGIVVGGSWLALNAYMSFSYKGYRKAYEDIKNMPAKSEREQLTRERLAEEQINRLGRLGKTMRYLSFATNGAASIYMLSNSKKDSKSQIIDGLAAAGSLLPMLFSNQWEDTAREQELYKRKIFSPVASTGLMRVPGKDLVVPGVLVSFIF